MSVERERLEAEVLEVEKEWRAAQSRFLVTNKNGMLEEPKMTSVTSCIGWMVLSVLGMAFLSATSLPVWITLLGLIPFSYGTFRLMIGSAKVEGYERSRTAYESRKGSILRKLDALRG